MDKRYNAISVSEQFAPRRRAVDAVFAHPPWSLRLRVVQMPDEDDAR